MSAPDSNRSQWFIDEVLPHEADLRGWLNVRFNRVQDVDDLVQEVFSRLVRAYDTGPVANPRAFLFVVARNLALNDLRHRRYEAMRADALADPLTIADEMAGPRDLLAKQEDYKHLVEAIQSLPERCRQIMTLRKIYGLSQKEVAERLGISVNTVEVQGGIGLRKCIEYFRQKGFLRTPTP